MQAESLKRQNPVTLNRKEMEERRLLAAQDLLLLGLSQAEVARKHGVSRTATSRWNTALGETKDLEKLRRRKAPGRSGRLTAEQQATLIKLYGQTDSPALLIETFSDVIFEMFRVRYHTDHVGRLMQRLGIPRRPRGGQPKF